MTSVWSLPGEVPITVDVERWASRLPGDAWPHSFATNGQVWRRNVFALADQWRAGEIGVRLFAGGVLAWGFGGTGYGPHRVRQILDADPAGETLEELLGPLRADTVPIDVLCEVYEQFRLHGIKGLGPSFFTKLLYFAGYRRGHGGVQPLILDRFVAVALPAEAGPARKYRYGWWASTWRRYIEWAAEVSGHEGCESDEVEIRLFQKGKRASE